MRLQYCWLFLVAICLFYFVGCSRRTIASPPGVNVPFPWVLQRADGQGRAIDAEVRVVGDRYAIRAGDTSLLITKPGDGKWIHLHAGSIIDLGFREWGCYIWLHTGRIGLTQNHGTNMVIQIPSQGLLATVAGKTDTSVTVSNLYVLAGSMQIERENKVTILNQRELLRYDTWSVTPTVSYGRR